MNVSPLHPVQTEISTGGSQDDDPFLKPSHVCMFPPTYSVTDHQQPICPSSLNLSTTPSFEAAVLGIYS